MSSTASVLPARGAGAAADPAGPGRSCPLDYRYGPRALRDTPALEADVLWIAGGLYGNTEALRTLQSLVEAESADRVELVFNGDFHWFDVDPAEFAAIQVAALRVRAMRGNVETELAREGDDAAAGCGCAYPDSVPQEDVDRSNAMAASLRRTALATGATQALRVLPMLGRALVGGLRVGIVHGDERSLSGWRLAHDSLEASRGDGLDAAFEEAEIDVLASSHTCLPVAATFRSSHGGRELAVINNGAAGMANFAGTTHGIATRIVRNGVSAPAGARILYRASLGGCELQAVAIDFDVRAWLATFDRQWPAGSPAERSYRRRIVAGPAYCAPEATRGGFAARPSSVADGGANSG
jgi:hypothetical protein